MSVEIEKIPRTRYAQTILIGGVRVKPILVSDITGRTIAVGDVVMTLQGHQRRVVSYDTRRVVLQWGPDEFNETVHASHIRATIKAADEVPHRHQNEDAGSGLCELCGQKFDMPVHNIE